MPGKGGDALEQPCAECQRPLGDHLVREMVACGLKPVVDLAYEDTPADIQELTSRFGFPEGTLIADHVTAKALVIATPIGPLPVLLQEFMVGRPGMPPIDVAQVAYLGGDTMRAYGRLIRDTASAPSVEQIQGYERLVATAFNRAFEEDPDRLVSAVMPYSDEEDGDE